MARLITALILSTLGGTILLHYLKNFFLEERIKFHFDWDGILERACLTYILISFPQQWPLIPLIILLKSLYRIALLGLIPNIIKNNEPGTSSQKVLFKGELAFDLILSPALAILLGVIFR
jgi:hypothetical protein